ncbi:MAG: alcohol dehydrogenase catalytic domain-containing protein [Planctomycetes bacterium]|nr:alcohol dehydrogenase catalytic domain-containing protein [Planctomycetota bacterium]
MKAIRLAKPTDGSFVLDDVPTPAPGDGQVLVKVRAAGICGTDRHLWHWDESIRDGLKPPFTPGHEFCGEIVELGKNVTHWKVNDYVSCEMHIVCNRCGACKNGKPHLCANHKVVGIHQDGTFAQYLVLPASNLIKLPAALPPKIGAFLDALGNAVHTALSTELPGRAVAILGFGPIGAMTAAVAEHCGAGAIFITDVNDHNLSRARAWAKQCQNRGTRRTPIHVLDVRGTGRREAIETVKSSTGGDGCDAVLEISGAEVAVNDGLEMLRPGGAMRLLGLTKAKNVNINNYNRDVVFKGVDMQGIFGRRIFDTWHQMLALLNAGLDVDFVVTDECALEDYETGLKRFDRGEAMKVVLYPNGMPKT